ncbi:synaptic vesicle 2-related protein-like [Amphiura filiformis]|uniref:synaptic vesicle 2-related protein-like n=1 Tax=Amphiura filiformis TaxID=82378 RepID=UPI003B2145FC
MEATRHRKTRTDPEEPPKLEDSNQDSDMSFKGIVNSFQSEVVIGDVVVFSGLSDSIENNDNGGAVAMVETTPAAEISVIQEDAAKTTPDVKGETTGSQEYFTVEEAIEHVGFGRFQLKMSAIICVIHMTDAGELMLLSMLSPELHCEWNLAKWQQALITTVVFVGYLIASPLWGMFADKFGRKKALIMVGFWIFTFGLYSSFSPNYAWMLVTRGITGFGIGGAAQNVVLYSEFLPTKVRGFWLNIVSFSWIIGVLWVVGIARLIMPVYGWRLLLIVAAMPLLLFITCCYFLPESAYYHAACGNKEAALDILNQLAKMNKKSLPKGELKVGAVSGADERGKLKDLFCDKETAITTSLLLFIWFSMAFVYYGILLLTTELFAKGHSCTAQSVENQFCFETCESLTVTDYNHLIITTLAEVPGTILTIIIIDYLGRKRSMTLQYICCAAAILMLEICFQKQIYLVILLFVARAFCTGAFQGIYVYTPEVYPTNVRGIGLGTCGSIARIGCIITPFVAQVLLEYSPHGTIGLYGGVCILAAIAIALLPIETKGRSMLSQVKEATAVISETMHYSQMT